jgi:four helix bundle protein
MPISPKPAAAPQTLTRFLQIALGSVSELEYQLLLFRDLNFLRAMDHKIIDSEVVEINKCLQLLFNI